jgi:type 1 glutamine amidotransferase
MSLFRLLLIVAFLIPSYTASAGPEKHVLIVVGPSNHPPGSHEVAAGARVLKHCLESMTNVEAFKVELVEHWPNQEQRDRADTVVFMGDTFPANRFRDPQRNLLDLASMMDRGCGIVCIHYATGLLGDDVTENGEHPLLKWMGGYFANRSCPHHESIARIYPQAKIDPATPDHPISRGWKAFEIHDEPYINNYFGRNENHFGAGVVAIAHSMLPPEKPQKETVAWCIERPDSGRGFGIVMPHFFKNWKQESLRRLILNGVVWTAQHEVPEQGVQSALNPLESYQPAAVEFSPRQQ